MSHLDSKTVYMDEFYNMYPPKGAHLGYDAPPDVLAMTSPHWLKYPVPHPFLQHGLGIFSMVLWFFCCIGNIIVIYIFIKVKSLRTPSNILVVTLAASDLILMQSQTPPLFVGMFYSKYWPWGQFWCSMYCYFGGTFGCGSLWMVIFIGYDRYNVIVNGFKGSKLTVCRALCMVLFAYCYSTFTISWPMWGIWSKFVLEGVLNTCAFNYLATEEDGFDYYYVLFLVCGNYVIPVCCICYFYSFIVKAVVSHERALRAQAKKMNVESLRSNEDANKERAEMKIAKVAITAVGAWLICWSPYAFLVTVCQYFSFDIMSPTVAQIPTMVFKFQACFNPIIYAISHPKFREALAIELPCLGIGNRPEEKEDTKTQSSKA